jgi:ubiquinone/menaquinone biosynthesis C-methylase UbiE
MAFPYGSSQGGIVNAKEHWERIYATRLPTEVSWYQREPAVSLELIRRSTLDQKSAVFDVGGGASTLVDRLVGLGYRNVTVLDLASSALDCARTRLKERAGLASWVCADVLSYPFPASSIDVWHDRAVFHFLTAPEDRRQYVAQVERAVRPGGVPLSHRARRPEAVRRAGRTVCPSGRRCHRLNIRVGRAYSLQRP